LSLKESWWEYLFAAGSITLEDAFIGKSVRKGGNFARRLNNRHQCLWFAFLLLAVCREQPDLSQIDSAAFAVREFALDIDPETLLRKARFANLKAAAGVIDEGLITSAKAAEMAKLFLGSRRKNKRHVIPVRKRPSNDK